MKQDSNNKSIDKNFKLMIMSAIALFVLLFILFIKSSSNIQGISYYVGLGFLFILLILSFYSKSKSR